MEIGDEVVSIAIQLLSILDMISPQITQHTKSILNELKTKKAKHKDIIYGIYFNQFLLKADFSRDKAEISQILLNLTIELYETMEKLNAGKKLKRFHTYRLIISNTLLVLQNAIALFGDQLDSIEDFSFF